MGQWTRSPRRYSRCRIAKNPDDSDPMTLDEIRAVLEAQGWPVERLSEATIRSRFRSKDRIFPLVVHLEPLFVTFAVIPFARLPEDPDSAEALMTRLLKLNHERYEEEQKQAESHAEKKSAQGKAASKGKKGKSAQAGSPKGPPFGQGSLF